MKLKRNLILLLVFVAGLAALCAWLYPEYKDKKSWETLRRQECSKNLRLIQEHKAYHLRENPKTGSGINAWTIPSISNSASHLKCLSGGIYNLNAFSNRPSCSVHGSVFPYEL